MSCGGKSGVLEKRGVFTDARPSEPGPAPSRPRQPPKPGDFGLRPHQKTQVKRVEAVIDAKCG